MTTWVLSVLLLWSLDFGLEDPPRLIEKPMERPIAGPVESPISSITLQLRAQGGHRDLLLVREGDHVITGAYAFATGEAKVPQRVFSRSFESVHEGIVSGNDPGFNAVVAEQVPSPYQSLPGDQSVTIHGDSTPVFRRNLAYWNGQGDVRFTAPPFQETLSIVLAGPLGPLGEIKLDGQDVDVPGFEFATTDPEGAIHQHLNFNLMGAQSPTTIQTNPTAVPSSGVYLVPIVLQVGSLLASEPAYLLLAHDVAPENLKQAHQCVERLIESHCFEAPANHFEGRSGCEEFFVERSCPECTPISVGCFPLENDTEDDSGDSLDGTSGCTLFLFDSHRSLGLELTVFILISIRRVGQPRRIYRRAEQTVERE